MECVKIEEKEFCKPENLENTVWEIIVARTEYYQYIKQKTQEKIDRINKILAEEKDERKIKTYKALIKSLQKWLEFQRKMIEFWISRTLIDKNSYILCANINFDPEHRHRRKR